MKLSILIVNWNTRELVLRCIDSIQKNAPNFDFEIIVVDNNSADGSFEALQKTYGTSPRIKIFKSTANLGFAKGNNLAYKNSSGDYILMLNPDTEVRPQALQTLANYLKAHADVGIVGPKIVNPDGSVQPSVRRFPGIWSSVLVFSGLHRFLRPKKYLMADFDYEEIQEVEQVMGAALLTKRDIIEKLGFLDEKFWLWYEEVDFCRRVKNAGYRVIFYPGAVVMHKGGESFAQFNIYARKKTLARSLIYYFEKNGKWWEVLALRVIMPLVLTMAWILDLSSTPSSSPPSHGGEREGMLKKTLILMLAAEALSLVVFVYNGLNLPLLIVIGLVTFWLALKRPELGIYLLFGELFVGSRGRMFEYGIVSLRIVVFGAVFLGWVINLIQKSKIKNQNDNAKFKIFRDVPKTYWLLLLIIVVGALKGFLTSNGLGNVFQDANGYLYLLILPAVLIAVKSRAVLENIFPILGAAIVVIAIKSLALFLWFGLDLPGVATAYHWVIESKAGEITGFVGSASRIFLASQFWSLVGVFVFGVAWIDPSLRGVRFGRTAKQSQESSEIAFPSTSFGVATTKNVRFIILGAAVLSIILSLSRSFWLGGIAGAIFAALVLLFYLKVGIGRVARLAGIVILIAVLEIGVLYGLMSLGGGEVSSTIASRIENPAQEAAGSARLLLLPQLLSALKQSPVLGAGFGKELSYESFLPDRITPQNPTGKITSYAFEWGYLDTLLKIGALGLLIYLLFIAHIFRLGFSKLQITNYKLQILGILAGLAALLVLNITTPYLNHPLGIGYLIFVYSYLFVIRKDNETAG